MRAVVLETYGGPEVLTLREVPRPVVGPEEVLVDVIATALNRADVTQRLGKYPGPAMEHEIPGLEFSGVIREIGARVTAWEPGDEVMGIVGGGGYAEQLAVHERQVMRIPSTVGPRDGAAIPEAWITAWDALVVQGGLTSGRVALIHGGASGVGTAAIQIARAIGATPIVTCSGQKAEACRAMGAGLAIDYRDQDFVAATLDYTNGAGADVVLDVVGGDYVARNLAALATQGTMVQVGSLSGANEVTLPISVLSSKRARLIGTRLRSRPLEEKCAISQRFAAEMVPLFDPPRQLCRPVIDRRYPLDEIATAHAYMESNASVGKIMIDVQPPR